ncbi:NAD(P)H-dependent oxidoreductase [Neisseriaceae bacterium CLB008]
MNTLIVVSHPDQTSFSHAWARRHEQMLVADQANIVDFVDLHQEQFNPAMGAADLNAYRTGAAVATDVAAMQQRLSRADEWVLVSPIYWWGLPAMLKGWLDRVLTRGFAYEDQDQEQPLRGLLQDKKVSVLLHGAVDEATFRKYGYDELLVTQLQLGVFGYCGVDNVHLDFVYGTERADFDGARVLATRYGPSH